MTTTKTPNPVPTKTDSARPSAKGKKPSQKAAATPSPTDDDRTLKMPAEDGKSDARMLADLVARGDAMNGMTAMRFTQGDLGKVDLTEMAAALRASGAAVNRGDLSEVERMLHAQVVSLNTIFCDMARRSHANFSASFLEAGERFMRLAFKAQSQCRATAETLAAVKNPPVVYARQMNVANGPQQVNNGDVENNGKQRHPATRTPETASPPNELLEDAMHGSTQLDTRATKEAGRGDPAMAPVGAIDGSAQ